MKPRNPAKTFLCFAASSLALAAHAAEPAAIAPRDRTTFALLMLRRDDLLNGERPLAPTDSVITAELLDDPVMVKDLGSSEHCMRGQFKVATTLFGKQTIGDVLAIDYWTVDGPMMRLAPLKKGATYLIFVRRTPEAHLIGQTILDTPDARMTIAKRIAATAAAPLPPDPADVPPWSDEVNGLRARLVLKRWEVFNGTTMIKPFLELQSSGGPQRIAWKNANFRLEMVDANGQPLTQYVGPFDGFDVPKIDFTLPTNATLSFDVSMNGYGVPADAAGMVESEGGTWVIKSDAKEYFLRATLEIPGERHNNLDGTRDWYGTIELPAAPVPLKPPTLDPATLEKKINQLGGNFLHGQGIVRSDAIRELSLINDPRVVPWYVLAMRDDELRFEAINRLGHFKEDAALNALKAAMSLRGEDVHNATTPVVAAQAADELRHSVAISLARSPHPDAQKLLITMVHDSYYAVRLTVLQELNRINAPQSLAITQSLASDPNDMVRNEAMRYLKERAAATSP